MWLRTIISRLRRWLRPDAPSPKPARRLRPQFERLEAREVPAAALNETYTASLIQGFLGRTAGATDLGFWDVQFAAGETRQQVAAEIIASPEFQGRELQLLYPALLNRPLDQAGLSAFGPVLRNGGGIEQVTAAILGSQEFFTDQASNTTQWLNAVYETQLSRSLDNAGDAFWNAQLTAGASRQQVAAAIIASGEAAFLQVADTYPLMLARTVDSTGATFWQNALLSGQQIENVWADIAGSDEYFNDLRASLARSNLADPNQAASQFLAEGGRFAQQLPGVVVLDRNLLTNQNINTLTDQIPVGTVSTAPVTTTSGTVIPNPTVPSAAGANSTLVTPTTSFATPGVTSGTPVGGGTNIMQGSVGSAVGAGASSSFAVGAGTPVGNGSSSTFANGAGTPFGVGAGSSFATGAGSAVGAGAGQPLSTGSFFV